MKIWIKNQVFDYIDFLREIKNISETTERTYNINLLEALKYIEIEKKDNTIMIDLMLYRVYIKDRAKKTIYKKLSIFNSFVKYLQKQSFKIKVLNSENIQTTTTLPKPVKDRYIKEAIEKAELEDKVLIELIYALGLRISEVASLKVEDILGDWVTIKGKGGKIRQLPLVKSVQNILLKYKEVKNISVYLFEEDGKKVSEDRLRYRVTKVFKEVGLKVTPHQLRHSFATELLQNGAKISDVSTLLGHSSLESTQIYTKLTTSLKLKSYKSSHPLSGKKV